MDLLSSSVTEAMISSLNGLSLRHKVISTNIANANTPGFQRSDVTFEDQLKQALEISKQNELKNERHSSRLNVNPIIPSIHFSENNNPFDNVKPIIFKDEQSPELSNGNTVNIEKEMVELAKNGSKYSIVAQLISKKYQGMSDLIKQAGI